MKITVFSRSHKGREGNTLIMVEEFLKGAEEAGAETENIILAEKNIEYCKGKFECLLKTPGKCTIRDDMDDLLPRFLASDIVVFACPVYFDNVPAIMKNFIDRLSPVLLPHFEEDEKGEYRHAKRYEKFPEIVVISNAGLPGQTNFEVESLFFLLSKLPKTSERIGSSEKLLKLRFIVTSNSRFEQKHMWETVKFFYIS
jgi:multimeric flavodoxin WrbA